MLDNSKWNIWLDSRRLGATSSSWARDRVPEFHRLNKYWYIFAILYSPLLIITQTRAKECSTIDIHCYHDFRVCVCVCCCCFPSFLRRHSPKSSIVLYSLRCGFLPFLWAYCLPAMHGANTALFDFFGRITLAEWYFFVALLVCHHFISIFFSLFRVCVYVSRAYSPIAIFVDIAAAAVVVCL